MSDDDQKDEKPVKSALRCSFCDRPQGEVRRLMAGPKVFICNECVDLCNSVMSEDVNQINSIARVEGYIPTPKQIRAVLDEYVIGQDRAKRVLSVAVYNHYKRLENNSIVAQAASKSKSKDTLAKPAASGKYGVDHAETARHDQDIEISKSNILLIGPTGCGKTLLAQTLAKILNVPFAIADATTLTEAGYVGEDVENILVKLVQAADGDVARAQQGIIYVDEVDKITRKSENPSITRDVSGEGVQQALLKIMEGTVASIPPHGGRKHPQQEFTQIDTSSILFICGGAFVGLEKIIEQHSVKGQRIGFGADVREPNHRKVGDILEELNSDDLHKFGLIPEFIGRLPVVATLHDLDEDALMNILSQPKNALTKQYGKLFDMEGVELQFTKDALEAIAKKALEMKSGARSLRAILENLLLDSMYEVPDMKGLVQMVVSKDTIINGKEPLYVFDESANTPNPAMDRPIKTAAN